MTKNVLVQLLLIWLQGFHVIVTINQEYMEFKKKPNSPKKHINIQHNHSLKL